MKDGNIPVYSSETSNNGVIGYCDAADFIINDNNSRYIVFGDHTRSINIVSTDFSVFDNVKVLRLKDEYKNRLSLLFIKFQWTDKIPNLGYSRHWKAAKEVEIKIPLRENGEYDIEKQKELAVKYQELEKQKNLLLNKIEYMKKAKIKVDLDYSGYARVELNKMVTHHNGKSCYTKEYCQKHSGNVSVFSANNNTPIAYMDMADYSGKYLTYSKQWLCRLFSCKRGGFFR